MRFNYPIFRVAIINCGIIRCSGRNGRREAGNLLVVELLLLVLHAIVHVSGNRRLSEHRRFLLILVILAWLKTLIHVVGLWLWLVICLLILTRHILVLHIAICWRSVGRELSTHSRSRLLLLWLLILLLLLLLLLLLGRRSLEISFVLWLLLGGAHSSQLWNKFYNVTPTLNRLCALHESGESR